jgi:hypothetical protein
VRWIRLSLTLLLCLALAGCMGGPQATARSGGPSRAAVGAEPVARTPTVPDATVNDLIKVGGPGAPTATPVETARQPSNQSPLTCAEQRIKQVSKGDILPAKVCY